MDQNQMPQGASQPFGINQSQGGLQPQVVGQGINDGQKQELLATIQQIKDKLGSLSATRNATKDKADLLRSNLLKQVFESLQAAGVDLTNRDSVSSFMAKLQQENPEMAIMFEEAMNILLGDQSSLVDSSQDPNAIMAGGVPPQNNMNNEINPNETISQNIQ